MILQIMTNTMYFHWRLEEKTSLQQIFQQMAHKSYIKLYININKWFNSHCNDSEVELYQVKNFFFHGMRLYRNLWNFQS